MLRLTNVTFEPDQLISSPLIAETVSAIPESSGREFFTQKLETARLSSVQGIRVSYRTTKGKHSTEDEMYYDLGPKPVITAVSHGALADSLYPVRFKPDFTPASFEHTYRSRVEGLDFDERYVYESARSTVFTDLKAKRSQRFTNDSSFADSVTMMEYLVFVDTSQLKELRMSTAVSPGAIRLPFIFRRIGEARVSDLAGRLHDCWVYEAEIDNLLSVLVKLFYGSATLWVMKDFPHLRVKMDFFHKTAMLKDYEINPTGASAIALQAPAATTF